MNIICFLLYTRINGVKILKGYKVASAADQMLFMMVKNNKDVYFDLLIVRDQRGRTLVFLSKENLPSLII